MNPICQNHSRKKRCHSYTMPVFFFNVKALKKTLGITVMNECNVIACRANGIKQEEEEGGVASLHTICNSFCSSAVNILRKKMVKAGEGFERATKPGHGLEDTLNERHGRCCHALLSIFTPVYKERHFCQ